VARSVLRVCRDVVAGLLLTMSCALLLDVLASRLGVAWLLALGFTSQNRRARLDYSYYWARTGTRQSSSWARYTEFKQVSHLAHDFLSQAFTAHTLIDSPGVMRGIICVRKKQIYLN